MTGGFELWRSGMARVADATGFVLLAWLLWQVMFGGSYPFETHTLWVGAIGAAACLLAPGAGRSVPWPMVAYIATAMVSAALNRRPPSPNTAQGWSAIFPGTVHLIAMGLFIFGGAYLLRSRQRVALFAIALVGSVAVLAVQILFDRATTNFEYLMGGSVSLPTVGQWGGLHQTGLLLLLAMPLTLALTLTSHSVGRVLAGLLLTSGFGVMSYLNGSRSGIIAAAASSVAMVLAAFALGVRAGWMQRALRAALLLIPLAIVAAIFAGATSLIPVTSLSGGRAPIWRTAWAVFRDHVLIGAGPGNYGIAAVDGGHAERFLPRFPEQTAGLEQAHNLFLQPGAETGAIGLICLLAYFAWMFRASWRAWSRGVIPLATFGLTFVLVAFLLRSISDSFLDLAITADRIRVVVWLIFAAILTLDRLAFAEAAARQAPEAARSRDWWKPAFALACASVVALEAYLVFAPRSVPFRIEGNLTYEMEAFAERRLISHAFRMRGRRPPHGDAAVEQRSAGDGPRAVAPVSRLHRLAAEDLAHEEMASIDVKRGRQWISLAVPRDGGSHDRWFSIELQLLDAVAGDGGPAPRVALIATHDNPDRGGVLFVDEVRKPGSLYLRTERRGRTLYDRVLAEAVPNLPSLLRLPAIQLLIAAALHWAFFLFAYTLIREARGPVVPRQS